MLVLFRYFKLHNTDTYFLVLGLAAPGTASPSTASAAATTPATATCTETSAKTSSTTGVVRHLLQGENKKQFYLKYLGAITPKGHLSY